MTDEYGFMAERDGDTATISDSLGGGTRFDAHTRDAAGRELRRYMRSCVDDFADYMADDLDFEEDDEEGEADQPDDIPRRPHE